VVGALLVAKRSTNPIGWIIAAVALMVAIFKYRLYDIDVVINRTLVYGPLTALLVLFYLGGVISLQFVFRALTGQESQIAIVVSTLVDLVALNTELLSVVSEMMQPATVSLWLRPDPVPVSSGDAEPRESHR
jgi:hypothetical protein